MKPWSTNGLVETVIGATGVLVDLLLVGDPLLDQGLTQVRGNFGLHEDSIPAAAAESEAPAASASNMPATSTVSSPVSHANVPFFPKAPVAA